MSIVPDTFDPIAPEAAAALSRAYALLRGVLVRSSYDLCREDAYDLGVAAGELERAQRGLRPPPDPAGGLVPNERAGPAPEERAGPAPEERAGPAPEERAGPAPEDRTTRLPEDAAAVFAQAVVEQRLLVRGRAQQPMAAAVELLRLWRQLEGTSAGRDGVADGSMAAAVTAALQGGPRESTI